MRRGPHHRVLALAALAGLAIGAVQLEPKPARAGVGSEIPLYFAVGFHHNDHEPIGNTIVDIGETVHAVGGLGKLRNDQPNFTGTVSFEWYANGTCTGAIFLKRQETVVNNVADPATAGRVSPGQPGTLGVKAFYSGDAYWAASQVTCQTLRVNKLASSVEGWPYVAGLDPITSIPVGDPFQIHVHVPEEPDFPGPIGTVEIREWSNGSCSGASSLIASVGIDDGTQEAGPFSKASPATVSFRLAYLGDSLYAASQSDCFSLSVLAGPTSPPTTAPTQAPPTQRPTAGPGASAGATAGATARASAGATPSAPTPNGSGAASPWSSAGALATLPVATDLPLQSGDPIASPASGPSAQGATGTAGPPTPLGSSGGGDITPSAGEGSSGLVLLGLLVVVAAVAGGGAYLVGRRSGRAAGGSAPPPQGSD